MAVVKIPIGLRKGDRVRIVHEDTVTAVYDDTLHTKHFVLGPATYALESVERIVPPLPTAPESVVRLRGSNGVHSTYVRSRDGLGWVNADGDKYPSDFLDSMRPQIDILWDAS